MAHELPVEAWVECVWQSALKPLEKLVALVFADRCRGPVVYVSYPDLMKRTGLSRDAVGRALRGVVDGGFLVKVGDARQHHATRYTLAQPSVSRTAEERADLLSSPSQPSVSRTREVLRTSSRRQQSVRRTAAASAELLRPAPAHCGQCDRLTRQLEDGSPCPRCSPHAMRKAAAS